MTDTRPAPTDAPLLGDLRKEIDRIDETMHRLLLERGDIIDRLIQVKQTQESGSAFRPAREADMMRRLVERHRGILPLDTAESIWRVIIATFTHVQAPFSVHADVAAGDAVMRDSARFHFGFTVPFIPNASAGGVVDAVAASKGDLGLVPAAVTTGGAAWWTALEPSDAPKIIARLPSIDRADHPAPLNVFVVSRASADSMVTEVQTWSLRVTGWSRQSAASLAAVAEFMSTPAGPSSDAALLVSVTPDTSLEAVTAALVDTGAKLGSAALVGSHATRYKVAPKANRTRIP